MTRLVFHIGYHKTATSWMQRRLFTPDHGFFPVGSHAEVFTHIVRPSRFDFTAQTVRDFLSTQQSQAPKGLVPILSSEILSGHPFYGGRESDLYAERLHAIAPEATVLISIRNQMKILPSVYMQYIRRGGTMPHPQFFDGSQEVGYFGFDPAHFFYDRLIGLYQSLFGADQVVVITQESLQQDLQGAAAKLAKRLGAGAFSGLTAIAQAPVAPSYAEFAIPVLRRINHVQTSVLNPTPIISLGRTPEGLDRWAGALSLRRPFTTLFGTYRPVSDYVRRHFDGVYTDANARLAQLVDPQLDLSAYLER